MYYTWVRERCATGKLINVAPGGWSTAAGRLVRQVENNGKVSRKENGNGKIT